MKEEVCATMSCNDGNALFEGRNQAPRMIVVRPSDSQHMFDTGVAEKWNMMVGHGLIERVTSGRVWFDVLRRGNPFYETCPLLDNAFKFRDCVFAIGMNARAEDKLRPGVGGRPDKIVFNRELCLV